MSISDESSEDDHSTEEQNVKKTSHSNLHIKRKVPRRRFSHVSETDKDDDGEEEESSWQAWAQEETANSEHKKDRKQKAKSSSKKLQPHVKKASRFSKKNQSKSRTKLKKEARKA